MTELTWSDKYAVGIDAIDNEHKELFDTLRELEAALARNAEAADSVTLLKRLVISTRRHFADEETAMREIKYPGLTLHVANHKRLMEKVEAFAARHNENGAPVNGHGLKFLRDWLLYHMENDDARLGAWMNDRMAV